jgi:pimeloyl-ACP methyl ester carboxylesterase
LNAVLKRLEQESVSTEVQDPFEGGTKQVDVDRQMFVAALHYALYRSATAARIPSYIHSAHEGDFARVIDAAGAFAGALMPQLSLEMFFSVVCAEDAPFYDEQSIVEASRDTLLGGSMSRSVLEACEVWPRGQASDEFKQPLHSNVPVLMISGESDPVTPPHLSIALEKSLIDLFVESGTINDLETRCVEDVGRPRFSTVR